MASNDRLIQSIVGRFALTLGLLIVSLSVVNGPAVSAQIYGSDPLDSPIWEAQRNAARSRMRSSTRVMPTDEPTPAAEEKP